MIIDINKYYEYCPQYNTQFLATPVNISNDLKHKSCRKLNISNIATQFLMIFRIQVSDNRVLDPFCFPASSTMPSGSHVSRARQRQRWRWQRRGWWTLATDPHSRPHFRHLKLFALLATAWPAVPHLQLWLLYKLPAFPTPSVNLLTQRGKSIEPTSGRGLPWLNGKSRS